MAEKRSAPKKRSVLETPPGPVSLFRGKVRKPVTLTLTKDHHRKVRMGTRRLGLTRADFIALLIEKYADIVQMPAAAATR